MIRRKFNSGGCGTPRNDGLKFARGEYIFFMDSDDVITKTAFEELYNIAEKFQADVICCEKFYQFKSDDKSDLQTVSCNTKSNQPVIISDKIEDRISALQNFRFFWNVWSKLIRRDFLLENNLEMTNIIGLEDITWTCCMACSAKKIVSTPNAINLYRVVEDSISHKKIDIPKQIKKSFSALIQATDYIDEYLNRQEPFQNRTDLKYAVFEIITKDFTNYILPIYTQVPAYEFDKILREEFKKHGDNSALTAFLFNRMNIFNINLIQQQQIIQQLQK